MWGFTVSDSNTNIDGKPHIISPKQTILAYTIFWRSLELKPLIKRREINLLLLSYLSRDVT